MNGHCADCHGPFNGEQGIKVVRLVHRACAGRADVFDAPHLNTPVLDAVPYVAPVLCRACDDVVVQDPQDLCPECVAIRNEWARERRTN